VAARRVGDGVASSLPGIGEIRDLLLLIDPRADFDDRVMAGVSLLASVVTVGAAPNFAAVRAARGIAPSSRALGQALEAAGHVRPASSAAHHIVAGNAPAAARARAVLERFGIGINDAANGVFLPASRAAPNAAGAAVHSTLHTGAYYQTVNQMLLGATTRAEAEAALGAIRQGLLSGGL
jgi:hypothetical protein